MWINNKSNHINFEHKDFDWGFTSIEDIIQANGEPYRKNDDNLSHFIRGRGINYYVQYDFLEPPMFSDEDEKQISIYYNFSNVEQDYREENFNLLEKYITDKYGDPTMTHKLLRDKGTSEVYFTKWELFDTDISLQMSPTLSSISSLIFESKTQENTTEKWKAALQKKINETNAEIGQMRLDREKLLNEFPELRQWEIDRLGKDAVDLIEGKKHN